MPKKRSKLKFRKIHLLPLALLLVVGGAVAFYGSTQLKPSHADTAAYYSCNSGDTLSGSTCTHTTTYGATYNSSSPYCNSPATYYSSSGNCAYPATATPTYTCNSGDSGGGSSSTCYHIYSEPTSGCGSDIYYGFGKCEHVYTTNNVTYSYSCPYGGNLQPSYYCAYTAYQTNPYYSCNNGDTLSGSTCTHTTTYAATYHPATTSGGSSTGGSTGGSTSSSGSSSTGSTTKKSTTATKSTSTPVTITPAQPPSAPTSLKAEVSSSKVIKLSWAAGNAPAGVQNYEVERSTDGNTWTSLGSPVDTSYTDSTTDFSTMYHYRVREVDTTGVGSDYATVDITTGKFQSTSNTITSDDKLVTVSIPGGSFDRPVSCSITSPNDQPPSVPSKSLLIGPYNILCIDETGTTIATFKKPLSVSMDLSGASSGFGGFQAQLFDDSSSSAASGATFDTKTRHLNFQLASDKSFAAYGTKQASLLGTLFKWFLGILLLAGAGVGLLYLRRYWAGRSSSPSLPEVALTTMPSSTPAAVTVAAPASPNAETFFEQAVNKPNCTHLNMAHQVQPQTSGCAECTVEHKKWKSLRICLTCGHVGCSDDSEEQHALKHYQQTGHPLIYEYGNPKGDSIGWCYIDQTYI